MRDSEADQRTLTELSPVGIVTLNESGGPIFMNQQARNILELETDAPFPASIVLEDASGATLSGEDYPLGAAVSRSTAVLGMHAWLKTSSGTYKALAINATPLPGLRHGGSTMIATLEDITERTRSLELLRQSEARFSQLFQLSPDSILLSELNSTVILNVNDTFTKTFDFTRDEAIGRTILELGMFVDGEPSTNIAARIGQDILIQRAEEIGRAKGGRQMALALSSQTVETGNSRYRMSVIRDITDLKKAQEMMVQTEKMISVGGIAAGIAHEINNPLGIVLQAAQNLVQRTRPDFQKNQNVARELGMDMDKVVQYIQARKLNVFIQDIQDAAVRASDIIRHMLDFSRRSESRRKICDLPTIVNKAVALAASDYDLKKSYDFKRISIERDYSDSLPEIHWFFDVSNGI